MIVILLLLVLPIATDNVPIAQTCTDSEQTPSPQSDGFLIKVELRFIDEKIGHGVFAKEFVKEGTPIWSPVAVDKLTQNELVQRLNELDRSKANEFLRQGFVLSTDLEHFCININDLGRYQNHSKNPNCGYADSLSINNTSKALRDILAGEEITCDYSGLGSPDWYKELCLLYGVIPTDEVAKLA